ncbi:transglutaminase family protein [Pseudoxanthobacter sp.]|uniref:transglutaminase family protein n=1 Tax=Pseudoxanthobacter sp. TaxID=1925742 RepID=UPI002FE3A215
MIYEIRHVTHYAYGMPTPFARHVLRLMPCDRPGLRVLSRALVVEPTPTERQDITDFFGNGMTSLAIDAAHEELLVTMVARLDVSEPVLPDPAATPDLAALRAAAFASADCGPRSPAHFLFASRRVPLEPEIRAYVAESVRPGRPVLEAALELNDRINEDFAYVPGATDTDTPPAVSFRARHGVCQDFAHVMISGLRGLGVPAAYVSGYLRTIPPAGQPRLQGADAMHAWVSVWCGPEAGWVELDPTNACAAGRDHIVLAIGRDYADVAPVEGVIVTSGGQQLGVAVDVVPAGDEEDAAKAAAAPAAPGTAAPAAVPPAPPPPAF